MKKKRILVTGAAGLIGKLIVPALEDNYQIIGLDRVKSAGVDQVADIADIKSLDRAFAKSKPIDILIHLAAASRPDFSWEDILRANIIGVRNIFECAQKYQVEKIIFASSIRVNGAYEGFPKTLHLQKHPKMIKVTDPVAPDSDYGSSKVFGEALARQHHEMHGTRVICLRLGSVLANNDPRGDALRMKQSRQC